MKYLERAWVNSGSWGLPIKLTHPLIVFLDRINYGPFDDDFDILRPNVTMPDDKLIVDMPATHFRMFRVRKSELIRYTRHRILPSGTRFDNIVVAIGCVAPERSEIGSWVCTVRAVGCTDEEADLIELAVLDLENPVFVYDTMPHARSFFNVPMILAATEDADATEAPAIVDNVTFVRDDTDCVSTFRMVNKSKGINALISGVPRCCICYGLFQVGGGLFLSHCGHHAHSACINNVSPARCILLDAILKTIEEHDTNSFVTDARSKRYSPLRGLWRTHQRSGLDGRSLVHLRATTLEPKGTSTSLLFI